LVLGTGSSCPQDFRFFTGFLSSLDGDALTGSGSGGVRREVSARQTVEGWTKPRWGEAASFIIVIVVSYIEVKDWWDAFSIKERQLQVSTDASEERDQRLRLGREEAKSLWFVAA
jgi:hypothetical protein